MLLSSMLLYAFISSFTPGPNNIMAMYLAQKHGFRKTFKFCLGVGTVLGDPFVMLLFRSVAEGYHS